MSKSAYHPTIPSPKKNSKIKKVGFSKPQNLPKHKAFFALLLASMTAGAVFTFALAPYHLWSVAVLSVMVFYTLIVTQSSAKRAFWLGEAYGFGLWAVGVFWLYTSIHTYGGVPMWLSLIMIASMALIMGLFHAVMALVFVRYMGKQPLAFAGLWVVQEWLKTWLFTGFPWLFVGYVFTDVAWMNSLAPIVGVLGISFVAVLFAGSAAELFRQKLAYFAISLAFVMVAVVIHLINPAWTKPTGDKLSVSLVQGNIPQDLKWLTQYRDKTLQIYADLSQSEWGRDVVIWPEAAIPMFQDEAWEFIEHIYATSYQTGSAWITGVPYKDVENFDPNTRAYPHLYNSVVAFDANQATLYKKQRLVPFGEYIPFEGLLNILPNLANMQDVASFSRGNSKQPLLMVKNKKLGAAICYEVAYPDTTRKNAKNSEFLLTISNDAWFGASDGPLQHLQMVQMRSLETGRYFVRATNTGVTSVINEKGKIVAAAPQFKRTVLRSDVPMMTGNTPFMYVGHIPVLVGAILLIIISLWIRQKYAYNPKTQKHYIAIGVKD